MPIVNASLEGDSIRYHQHINIGIAVALEWGLIVPVIKEAEEKNFLGIARAIADLAERARGKKLKPDEVASGTFTITNPGIFGEQFGMPIINQPESAILGVGGLFKEPAVVTSEDGTDSIAIRNFIHLTLGLRSPDHRRRRRGQVHGRGEEVPRKVERGNRLGTGCHGSSRSVLKYRATGGYPPPHNCSGILDSGT